MEHVPRVRPLGVHVRSFGVPPTEGVGREHFGHHFRLVEVGWCSSHRRGDGGPGVGQWIDPFREWPKQNGETRLERSHGEEVERSYCPGSPSLYVAAASDFAGTSEIEGSPSHIARLAQWLQSEHVICSLGELRRNPRMHRGSACAQLGIGFCG